MSNVPAQQGKLSATLVLDDAVRLAGQISSLLDGRLRLDGVQSIDVPATSHIVDTVSGSFATLSIAQADPLPCPLEEVRVKIASLHEDSLTLEFAPSDAEVAARYREAITGLELPGDKSTPIAAVVAASNEIGKSQSAEAPAEKHKSTSRPPLTSRGPRQISTPVTAEYAKLLDSIQVQSLAELNIALGSFFSDLSNHLPDLASQDGQGAQAKNDHNEAALILQRNGHQIAQQMFHQLTDYFIDLTPDASDDHLWQYTIGKTDKLDLIDLQEFEDFLAIDRMVTQGEDLHNVALEALTFRMATLIGANANRVRLPIDVRQLCRAFQCALQQDAIPHSVLSPIFDYFSSRFIRQLDGFYAPINSLLANSGVLPDIEIEIETKGSLLERNRQSPKREAKARARKPKEQKPKKHDADTPSTEAIKELNELHRLLWRRPRCRSSRRHWLMHYRPQVLLLHV